MRILLGTESFYPNISGVTVFTFQLARNLTRAGYTVAVCAPSPDRRNHTEQVDGFTVYRFGSIVNIFRRGFRVTVRPLRAAAAVVEQFRPDIIHLQDPTSICSCLHTLARRRGIPLVATYHFSMDYILSYIRGLKPFFPLIRRYLVRYLNRFYNTCERVTCPTETVRRNLLRQGVTVPIHAFSNGVDLDRFYPFYWRHAVIEQYHLPWPQPPIVLYTGRLDQDKSVHVLLKAIPQVIARTNAHFVIAGGGNKLRAYRRWIQKRNLERWVSFTGLIPHEDPLLVQLYQTAQLFVIPSTIETQSIVTMEAMAAALPVVAVRAGALPELVDDGATGFLVRPNDPGALAERIVYLLKHPLVRTRQGQRALERVEQHRLEGCFQEFVELYAEVRR